MTTAKASEPSDQMLLFLGSLKIKLDVGWARCPVSVAGGREGTATCWGQLLGCLSLLAPSQGKLRHFDSPCVGCKVLACPSVSPEAAWHGVHWDNSS